MSTNGFMHDPARRLPLITSAEAYDALSHLSDEEKQLGKDMMYFQLKEPTLGTHASERPPEHPPELIAAQARNPYMVFQWDPELFKLEIDSYERMASLVLGMTINEIMDQADVNAPPIKDPDARRRYETAHFMELKVTHDLGSDWGVHVLASLPRLGAMLKNHQFALLGMPGSALWDDEQRLILQFTEGVINRSVTDELYRRAEEFWGLKQMLRYSYWIAYYAGIACMVPGIILSDEDRTGRL